MDIPIITVPYGRSYGWENIDLRIAFANGKLFQHKWYFSEANQCSLPNYLTNSALRTANVPRVKIMYTNKDDIDVYVTCEVFKDATPVPAPSQWDKTSRKCGLPGHWEEKSASTPSKFPLLTSKKVFVRHIGD